MARNTLKSEQAPPPEAEASADSTADASSAAPTTSARQIAAEPQDVGPQGNPRRAARKKAKEKEAEAKRKARKSAGPLKLLAAMLVIGALVVAGVVVALQANGDDGPGDSSDVAASSGDDADGTTGNVANEGDEGSGGDVSPGAGTDTPGADATPAATSVPLPEGTVRWVGNTAGRGVATRTGCQQEARSGNVWPEGTKVTVTARGTGACASWSVATSGSTQSWVRNEFLAATPGAAVGGGGGAGSAGTGVTPSGATEAVVTGTTSSLVAPGASWAQRYCIQYRTGSTPGEVCRTFPSVQRSGWTAQDQQTYANLTDERQQFFIDCYLKKVVIGKPLDSCAFAPL